MYGGKIWFHGDNGEKLSVPYGGKMSHCQLARHSTRTTADIVAPAGVAYDTEKEFDTMFTGEPSVSGSRSKFKLASVLTEPPLVDSKCSLLF
jgi:hypothetical protein